MAIKPLEKKNIKGLYPKLFFLGLLLIAGLTANIFAAKISKNTSYVLQKQSILGVEKNDIHPKKIAIDFINSAESTSTQVLSATTQLVLTTASKSANIVSDFVYQNTLGKIVEQVKVLPKDQRERIREEICK